jgi:hypothetical protein
MRLCESSDHYLIVTSPLATEWTLTLWAFI